MPTIYSSLLSSDLVWTDAEASAGKKYLKWEEVAIRWEEVDLLWEEVFVLLEAAKALRGGGGSSGFPYRADAAREYREGNPWKIVRKKLGEEKAKTLIRVYCRVKGVEYDESRQPMEDVKVTMGELQRFVKEAVSVKVGF